MGDADRDQRDSFMTQLRAVDSRLTVFLVDERVLHPWTQYTLALELVLSQSWKGRDRSDGIWCGRRRC